MSDLSILYEMKTTLEEMSIFDSGSTVTLTAAVSEGDETLSVTSLSEDIPGNKILWFSGGVPVVVLNQANQGDTSITIEPATSEIVDASTAQFGSEVLIEEWGILDVARDRAPYVIFEVSREVQQFREGGTPNSHRRMQMHIFTKWFNWDQGMIEFGRVRDLVLDKLWETYTYPTLVNWRLVTVETGEEIYGRPDPYTTAEMIDEAPPVFLGQLIYLIVEEYPND